MEPIVRSPKSQVVGAKAVLKSIGEAITTSEEMELQLASRTNPQPSRETIEP